MNFNDQPKDPNYFLGDEIPSVPKLSEFTPFHFTTRILEE